MRLLSRCFLIISVCGICGVLGGSVVAQPDKASTYHIRPGDSLDIGVIGHEEWSLQVSVRPDGRISYPATGEIKVAGLSIGELTKEIEQALGPEGRHLRDPQVVINVSGLRTPVAYVLGAVEQPGTVELPEGVSGAAKVLTMVGGGSPEGDLTEVTLYRNDGTRTVINLEGQLQGEAEQTPIRAGDVIVVPETQQRFVGVLGAVGKTGEIPLPPKQEEIDMLELLVQIGGVSEGADRDRALILRQEGSIDTVALNKVLAHEIAPPILHSGDVLWVPPQPPKKHFAVTGAVESPGRFDYRSGTTLADALALAGSPAEVAALQRVMLIHADGEKETLNVMPMLQGKEPEVARTPIKPKDIILVPSHDKSYAVLGAVGNPGIYAWSEDTQVLEALIKAGGANEGNAEMSHVKLVRRPENGGEPTVREVDAQKLLQGEAGANNRHLQPGDTIYVPSKDKDRWRDNLTTGLTILGAVNTFGNLFGW